MDLVFMSVQPDDNRFVWELEAQIENFLETYTEYEYHVLIFKPVERTKWNINMQKLEKKYANTNIKFFWYAGDMKQKEDMLRSNYIPLLRPYCLQKHFELFPELNTKAIFYYDSDVLFTKKIDFEKYLQDDICYLSNTSHYLNLEYLESKIEEAEKKDELRAENPIGTIALSLGINKNIIRENNEGTGGAQYLLKGLDSKYWKDVYNACISIRNQLSIYNKMYFPSEDHGWQSWCADMWAVLWNLWKRKKKTECPSEFDFSWASDPIERVQELSIYHNAGIHDTTMNYNGEDLVVFYKGKYTNNGISPHNDKFYLSLVTDKLATRYYVDFLLKITDPVF